jgi:hypothetical protein
LKTVQQASIPQQILYTAALLVALYVGKYCLENGYPLVAYLLAFGGALIGAHQGAFLYFYLHDSRRLARIAWGVFVLPFSIGVGLCLGYRDMPWPPLEIVMFFFVTGGLGGLVSAGARRTLKIKDHLSYVTD